MTDEQYMRMALRFARRGAGWTSPNPMVGAVIVGNGEVLGTGYHKRFGEAHAEVNAINAAGGSSVEGATIYVTLEPVPIMERRLPVSTGLLKPKCRGR